MNKERTEFLQTESEDNQQEYIQYAQEVEQALTSLEAGLHNTDDPEEIIMGMLQAATMFYDGDWAGIMEADLTMKIWSTLFWYNRHTGGMTPNHFDDLEEGEYLVRWIEALTNGQPIIIRNIESIKETSPLEYEFMVQNNVQAILAVPFWKRPTGFLIVRNPKRYITRSSLLQMMAFVAVSSINEKRLRDRLRQRLAPDIIQAENDVVINLFGELQLITSSGALSERELNSQQITRLIAYLLLHKARPASPIEIFNVLWPEEDSSKAPKRLRNLVYRTQQLFGSISNYRLIDSTVSGYRINPELNIHSDSLIFEECWHHSQIAVNTTEKMALLKKAIATYKEGLCADFYSLPWFMPTVSHYSMRYEGVLNQLLLILNESADYRAIQKYANNAIHLLPGSSTLYFWLIYSMKHLGATEIARNELKAAKQALTEIDYKQLISQLADEGLKL